MRDEERLIPLPLRPPRLPTADGKLPTGMMPVDEEKEVGGREPVEGVGAPRAMETVSDCRKTEGG